MNLSNTEYRELHAKLEGIFELRDLMMKVRKDTMDIEKNHSLSNAIQLSFEITEKYLEKIREAR